MSEPPGPLLQHLPAIYHSVDDLRVLLSVFEEVLLGSSADGSKGLEESIRQIPALFDPDPVDGDHVSPEFLPWLAQWVALSRIQGLSDKRLGKVIGRIVPLYAKRGTKCYMAELLALFIRDDATITIDDQEMSGLTVGKSSIGVDSWLGGDRPFWFRVKVRCRIPATSPDERQKRLEDTVRSVVDLAKPAHTAYHLEWEMAQ